MVSGALDRLQGEYDPPCKYMSDKKMWRYLHMGRSEEEFMRKHNEKMCGHKLPKDKKAEKRKKTAVETAAVDLPSQEELMQVSISKLLYYYSESAMPKNTPGAFTCKSCDTERNLFCNHTFVYVRSVKNSQITFFKCQNTA